MTLVDMETHYYLAQLNMQISYSLQIVRPYDTALNYMSTPSTSPTSLLLLQKAASAR
jgi:hypothetical protein